nr:MAG TPA: hypothetical protein [Caudoviricetes sp.]
MVSHKPIIISLCSRFLSIVHIYKILISKSHFCKITELI